MSISATLRLAWLVLVLLASAAAAAQTMYRWIDPKTGGTVISDQSPPPGTPNVTRYTAGSSGTGERQTPYAVRRASDKFPVVLYSAASCTTTCQQARDFLNQRGVPFTEKVLNTQEEFAGLARALGNEVVLPSISVGRQQARGFVPAARNDLLDAAADPAADPSRSRQ